MDISDAASASSVHPENSSSGNSPYLTILEEPVDRFRFRYKTEISVTNWPITGKNSTRGKDVRTYPTVELRNYDQPAIVRCSLYQHGKEDEVDLGTRLLHAHQLVRRQCLEDISDPHEVQVDLTKGYIAVFDKMGIARTTRKNLATILMHKNCLLKQEEIAANEQHIRALTVQEELEVKVLSERESKHIDLNVVCLRFDAYTIIDNIYYPLCPPVYSNAIRDRIRV